ncbi:hypothetical protein EDB85DRAFT_1886606 [Lactarius pseudohatsudake]|nr:hypothetical protein EDB85DRAFT_1886606 [Lactarius pseudohatsudake]
MPVSTKPKPITAKTQPMGPPPAPSSGGVDDLDEFDFMSKIPSPPKRKKPVFEDFMDLIPASQRVVWSSSGAPVIKPAALGDSTADDSLSPAAEDTVSDTMEVDDGGKEARSIIPATPTEPRSLPKARPIVQSKARDVQPCGSRTHVTKPRGHTQSVGTTLQNPVLSARPSTRPPSSDQPTHPMGIVVPPPRNPQDIADLEARCHGAVCGRLLYSDDSLSKL